MIYLPFVMYKTFIFIILFSFGFGQENFKSIHQIELNYNKENYLEPLFKPYLGPADPSKLEEMIHQKRFLDITPIGKEQNGSHIIMICLQQLLIFQQKQIVLEI